MDEQAFELVKGGANILTEIYRDTLQPSLRVIGTALGTVIEYVSGNFVSDWKFKNEAQKLNLQRWLDDYAQKLNDVPEEKVCDVKLNIGVPIIEKLAYTTNDKIADMFTTLLASASNSDRVNTAHPSFVDIIGHLSADEARIIRYLRGKEEIAYCHFRGTFTDSTGYRTIREYATTIPFDVQLESPNNINAYLENLVCQGILSDKNDAFLKNDALYEKIKETNRYEQLKGRYVPKPYKEIDVAKGFFNITNLGKMFIKACTNKRR